MSDQTQAAESILTLAAKFSPPISVSAASLAGMSVSNLVLWATLAYTVLLILHKVYSIYQDVRGRNVRSAHDRRRS